MLHLLLTVWLSILFSMPGGRGSIQQPASTGTPINPPASETPTPTLRPTVTPVITTRPQITISAPSSGQAVQGKLAIWGTSAVNEFLSAELAFSYADDPTNTWFWISSLEAPVSAGLLAEWDTTQISDGEYDLRLLVTLVDGTQLSTLAQEVRVRNYTPIETSTPTPLTATSAAGIGSILSNTSTYTPNPPTLTPLPPNPAQVSSQDLAFSFAQGALLVAGLFALGGLYAVVQQIRYRRNSK